MGLVSSLRKTQVATAWKDLVGRWSSPSVRDNKRTLDPGYEGPIFVWDIDKTYLLNETDTFLEIMSIALERARDKVNVPGTPVLLQHLKRGTGRGNAMHPLFFLTSSPPQIGGAFEEKLRIDGVESDGITYKNFAYFITSLQWEGLTRHIGYKVVSLLRNRIDFPNKSHELLFGDNSEQDPTIYSLYSNICSRRLEGELLREGLAAHDVQEQTIDLIIELQAQLPKSDPVRHIYIHQHRRIDPGIIEGHHPATVAYFNTFQAGCKLVFDGYLTREGLREVSKNLRECNGFTQMELAQSLLNFWRREHLTTEQVDEIIGLLCPAGHLPPDLRREDTELCIMDQPVPIQDVLADGPMIDE